MNPGELTTRVTLLQPTQTTHGNPCNEVLTDFGDAGAAWAKVEPLGGGESQKGKQIGSDATYRVTLRYNATIDKTWRFRHGTVELEILSLSDTGTRHEELVAECKEVR